MTFLEAPIDFEASNGGVVTVYRDSEELERFGVENGWAVWNDLHINPSVDMTLDISEDYDTTAKIEHLTGDAVLTFSLTSRQPNGLADIRIEGLKPRAWYRLRFDNLLAETDSGGVAHGQTTDDGILQFNNVVIPDG